MTTRTDEHRPSVIRPVDYSHVLFYSLATIAEGWPVPAFNVDLVVAMRERGEKFAATGGLGKCSICGASYVYGQIWKHEPTGEHIHVGHDCAEKYEFIADHSDYEIARDRAVAAARAQTAKEFNARRRADFLAAHEGLEAALATEHEIVQDIAAKFRRYCDLSEKQIALVFKIAGEKSSPRPVEAHVPAPMSDKRQTFTGTIVSAKIAETQFGTSVKITVKVSTPAGTWLAWGTAPAAMIEEFPCGANGRIHAMRGSEVQITARLEAGREAHFAFMKRPTGKVVRFTEETSKVLAEEKERAPWLHGDAEGMAAA